MAHRAFIRRTISDTFFSFVYETDRFNGIGELLEILGEGVLCVLLLFVSDRVDWISYHEIFIIYSPYISTLSFIVSFLFYRFYCEWFCTSIKKRTCSFFT